MKRIWFAIIFILITAGLCIGEQSYVKKVYTDLNNEISKSQTYESKEDLAKSVKSIQQYWEDNNDMLFAIADHGVLDDLSAQIRSLDANDEDIKGDLMEIEALVKVFYENQRVTLSNVF